MIKVFGGSNANSVSKADIVDNLNSNDESKVLSAKQGKLLGDDLNLKADSDNLRQHSTFFVDELVGNDNNDGQSLDKPWRTVVKGILAVPSYSILKINGQGNKSGNASFSNNQFTITFDISPAVTINGTIGLVSGNTYMSFVNGAISATINDFSGGKTYLTNVNLDGSTINFIYGEKTITNCKRPNVIHLTGAPRSGRNVLRLENISGGAVKININSTWDVHVVNCQLDIVSNDGNVYYEDSSIVKSVIESQSALNTILSVTHNAADGLYALNFDNPVIAGLSVSKGDIIRKISVTHAIAFPYAAAPATISVVKTATEQNTYHKESAGWFLTKNKLNPVENGTANHLVSQDAGGKLESTNINKNDVALIDPNATANNIAKFDNNGQLIDAGIPISDINNQRVIWAYQDFNPGTITGTNVTLTTGSYNEIAGSDFNATKIINSAFIVRSDNIEKYAYSGAVELFSYKIKVSNISGTTVALSNVPHSSYPIRIYFQYNCNGYPANYSHIKKILAPSALDELNSIIATQDEVDGKLSKSSNFSDVADIQNARNTVLGAGNINDVITLNSSGNWVASAGGGGISDAPSNGLIYSRKNASWVSINIPNNSSGSINPENSIYGSVGDIFTDSLTGNSYYKFNGNNNTTGWALITRNNDIKSYLTTSEAAYNAASDNTWIEVTNDEYSAILQNERMYVIGTPLKTFTDNNTAKLTLQFGTKGSFYGANQTATYIKDHHASVFEKTKFYGFRIYVYNYNIRANECQVKSRVGTALYDVGGFLPASSKTNDYANFILKNPSQVYNMPYLGFQFKNINGMIHYYISNETEQGYYGSGTYYSINSMSLGYDFGIDALVGYV
jgi:hypothetical protein